MLRKRSPATRVWFTLFLGAVGTPMLTLLGKDVSEVFTVQSGLEAVRIGLSGAITALIALHVAHPKEPRSRD